LASHFKTYTTQGNLNNHIGIPLTILQVRSDAEMAVVEMGANHQKEIEGYCKYTEPTHGIITNCGKAHLEGFGGIEGVRKGKGELFDYLRKNDGTAFIFKEYEYLVEMSKGIDNVINYGTADAFVTGTQLPSDTFLQVQITDTKFPATIKTQLVGDYNLPNILCAVAVGKHFDVPFEKIIKSIEGYIPGNSRSQMLVKGSNHIILDAYNANPTSMRVAIENIAGIKSDSKVLMLGGMMELGEESIKEHQNIVELIKKYSWRSVIFVGGDFAQVNHPFLYFNNVLEAAKWSQDQKFQDSYFLIKGSRSIKMEIIAEYL
jgi:UDP-N-acetylmuramoyl-tripeptide--D-alanyl-D-alanine ligase